MRKKQLPHISRNFPAGFGEKKDSPILWIALIIFFLLLLLPFYNSSSTFEELKSAVLKDYQNPNLHLELAREYQKVNDLTSAKRELILGLNYQPENRELKIALKEIENLLHQPERVQEEIDEWEKISQDFPGYRDAYLKLAQLYFELYQNEKAKENLDKALELDPNFEPAQQAKKILENKDR